MIEFAIDQNLDPFAERVRTVLDYDPEDGRFYWAISAGNRKAGSVAGHSKDDGTLKIQVFGKKYIQSRLAWLYMTGTWPAFEVWHLNGDITDNSWKNLVQLEPGQVIEAQKKQKLREEIRRLQAEIERLRGVISTMVSDD